jgi:hypothetical protein
MTFREGPTGVLGTTYTHPDYNPNTGYNDVDRGPRGVGEPARVPNLGSRGFLSDLKASGELREDTFLAVGYGLLNGWPPPQLEDNESRFFSVSSYRASRKNNLVLSQTLATGNGGTCFGDSGGPHFWEETLIIVSVTSWGDAICNSTHTTHRVDIASVLDWLADEFGVTPA